MKVSATSQRHLAVRRIFSAQAQPTAEVRRLGEHTQGARSLYDDREGHPKCLMGDTHTPIGALWQPSEGNVVVIVVLC